LLYFAELPLLKPPILRGTSELNRNTLVCKHWGTFSTKTEYFIEN